jgi:redox-sensitive bicupin YhaK (pirin superfamily)
LRLVGSRDARDGAVTIHQDVDLYAGVFRAGEGIRFDVRPGRHAWIQVARGALTLNGNALGQGDGAAVSDEDALNFAFSEDSEILLFDLA